MTPQLKKQILFVTGLVALGTCLTGDALAVSNESNALLKTETTQIENLITGSYMRIGMFVVCAVAAVMAGIRGNIGLMLSGGGACIFLFLMKGWIGTTFAMVM